jgi:hypothetical protein
MQQIKTVLPTQVNVTTSPVDDDDCSFDTELFDPKQQPDETRVENCPSPILVDRNIRSLAYLKRNIRALKKKHGGVRKRSQKLLEDMFVRQINAKQNKKWIQEGKRQAMALVLQHEQQRTETMVENGKVYSTRQIVDQVDQYVALKCTLKDLTIK